MITMLAAALAALIYVPTPVPEIALPDNPQAVAISLTFIWPHEPMDRPPAIVIRADGQFESTGGVGNGPPRVTGRLAPDEVLNLLWYLAVEQRLREYDAEAVRAAVEAERRKRWERPAPPGETVQTVLCFRVGRETFELKVAALDFYTLNYGRAVPELQRLQDSTRRLQDVACRVHAGGDSGLTEALKLANERLKAQHPTVPALVVDDFQHAEMDEGGARVVYFHRRGVSRGEFVRAEVHVPVQGPASVVVEVSRRFRKPFP